MNDEALEIETSSVEASNEKVLEDTADISSDMPLARTESEVSDTDAEAEAAPVQAENMRAGESDNERLELKAEIDKLRAEIDSIGAKRAAFISEIKEFAEIFGADNVSNIPDEVWESTNRGVPLAAAYALYEKKAAQRAEMTERVNKKNESMSAGAIKNATNPEFFSPTEVRAMSAKEVKKNYNRIIESMKKWN